jgi:hypothetical protein
MDSTIRLPLHQLRTHCNGFLIAIRDRLSKDLLQPVAFGAISAALVMTSVVAQSQTKSRSKDPCDGQIIVSLSSALIGGINLTRPIGEIERQIGRSRISPQLESREGRASRAWDLDFCGHVVRRHWNGLSWTDARFRTATGLGVGSTLSEFDRQFGVVQPYESESTGVRYPIAGGNRVFSVSVTPACYGRSARALTVDRSCAVTSMFVPTESPQ